MRRQNFVERSWLWSAKLLKLTLLYNTSENHQKIAIAVASMWKKNLGVDVKLQNQEWKTYIDSRNTGNFDVIRASWVGDYNEPSTFLTLLTSTHSGNISRFNNPAYDKVLAQASTENTVKARNADYNAAEKSSWSKHRLHQFINIPMDD